MRRAAARVAEKYGQPAREQRGGEVRGAGASGFYSPIADLGHIIRHNDA